MKNKGWRNPTTELGKAIYKIRQTNHLTQKEFAEVIGTRQGVVSNWESGRIERISKYWGKVILEKFGVDLRKVNDGK